jgi:hypothetical protein
MSALVYAGAQMRSCTFIYPHLFHNDTLYAGTLVRKYLLVCMPCTGVYIQLLVYASNMCLCQHVHEYVCTQLLTYAHASVSIRLCFHVCCPVRMHAYTHRFMYMHTCTITGTHSVQLCTLCMQTRTCAITSDKQVLCMCVYILVRVV